MKRYQLIFSIIAWIILIGISFIWNYSTIIKNNEKIVLNKSQSFFNQILITRSWNASHGGVYVPISEITQPNPYLKDTLKNITSIEGMQLTKVNPSFMTRQVAELNGKKHGIQFHITSLNCIRPENKPSKREVIALKQFENGAKEVLKYYKKPEPTYMYMAPLIAEKSCLKCHGDQGYHEGGIRGGISVSFPALFYAETMKTQIFTLSVVHIILLTLGILGIRLFYLTNNRYFSIIKNQNKELKNTLQNRDKLYSIIAHDLRSPFSAILGFLDILHTDYKHLHQEEIISYINDAHTSANNTYALLNNLLLWTKSQQEGIILNFQKINIHNSIKEIILTHQTNFRLKEIKLEVNISNDLCINADKFTFQCIVSNLLSNSIKFTPKFGNIIITSCKEKNLIKIKISDTGVGMTDEKVRTLFIIESQESTQGTNGEKGSGLGLLLCKEFTEKNNGNVRVVSNEGQGTEVILKFPVYGDS